MPPKKGRGRGRGATKRKAHEAGLDDTEIPDEGQVDVDDQEGQDDSFVDAQEGSSSPPALEAIENQAEAAQSESAENHQAQHDSNSNQDHQELQHESHENVATTSEAAASASEQTNSGEGDNAHAEHETSYIEQTFEASNTDSAPATENQEAHEAAHAAAQAAQPPVVPLTAEEVEQLPIYKEYHRLSSVTGYLFSDVQNSVVTSEVLTEYLTGLGLPPIYVDSSKNCALIYLASPCEDLAEKLAQNQCAGVTLTLATQPTSATTVFLGNLDYHLDDDAAKAKLFQGFQTPATGLLGFFIVRSRDNLHQSLGYAYATVATYEHMTRVRRATTGTPLRCEVISKLPETFEALYSPTLLVVHPAYLNPTKEELIEYCSVVAKPASCEIAVRADGTNLGLAFLDFANHDEAINVWRKRAGAALKGTRVRLCFVNPSKTGAAIVSEITSRSAAFGNAAPRPGFPPRPYFNGPQRYPAPGMARFPVAPYGFGGHPPGLQQAYADLERQKRELMEQRMYAERQMKEIEMARYSVEARRREVESGFLQLQRQREEFAKQQQQAASRPAPVAPVAPAAAPAARPSQPAYSYANPQAHGYQAAAAPQAASSSYSQQQAAYNSYYQQQKPAETPAAPKPAYQQQAAYSQQQQGYAQPQQAQASQYAAYGQAQAQPAQSQYSAGGHQQAGTSAAAPQAYSQYATAQQGQYAAPAQSAHSQYNAGAQQQAGTNAATTAAQQQAAYAQYQAQYAAYYQQYQQQQAASGGVPPPPQAS